MSNRVIYITEHDMERLRELLEVAKHANYEGRDDLRNLEAELDRSQRVAPEDVPPDVITMNSTTHLTDLDTGEDMIYTLVFPDDADMDADKISVLAPIGTAMLGYKVGDTFEWKVPDGLRRLHVKEVLYQPEASGDYDL